nr:MAG TPA_asm: hypothetical protein [Caudoviricetes sp.]
MGQPPKKNYKASVTRRRKLNQLQNNQLIRWAQDSQSLDQRSK